MKKQIKVLITALTVLSIIPLLLSSCAAKDSQETKPEKKADIEDFEKAYFEGLDSKIEIDLSEYIDDKGVESEYSAVSSDPSVAEVSVIGKTLTVLMGKDSGETTVTVTVKSGKNSSLSLDFKVTAKSYKKIACIGDSLTYGHSWHDEAYPVYLSQLLGNSVSVKNYGVNGAAVTQYCTTEKQYKTLPEYTSSLAEAPDIAVFMLGTNDSKLWSNGASGDFLREYKELIFSYYDANPDMVTIIVTAPPTADENDFSIPDAPIKTEIVPKQLEIAEFFDAHVIDFRELTENYPGGTDSLFRDDGVHLSVAGAQYLAELVYEVIASL